MHSVDPQTQHILMMIGGPKRSGERRSFSREVKLAVLDWMSSQRQTVDRTARTFGLEALCIRRWRKQKLRIMSSEKGTCKLSPLEELEMVLAQAFHDQQKQGCTIRYIWFRRTAERIFKEIYPDRLNEKGKPSFRFGGHWFRGFCQRKHIAYPPVVQSGSTDEISKLQHFHRFLRQVAGPLEHHNVNGAVGKFDLSGIVNVDRTPLGFDFIGSKCEMNGGMPVWIKNHGIRRQCTVQLAVHADGVLRFKPLVVFEGLGTRIEKTSELKEWDSRVDVTFQPKALVDEGVMIEWIKRHYSGQIASQMLVLDVYKAPKTDRVLQLLKDRKVVPVMIPPGCARLVQPFRMLQGPFQQACSRIC